jgi:hypothetical protein
VAAAESLGGDEKAFYFPPSPAKLPCIIIRQMCRKIPLIFFRSQREVQRDG